MTAPEFTVLDGVYALRSPAGLLEWLHDVRGVPVAVSHHANPRWPDEQPFVCTVIPGGVCYADSGALRGPYLEMFETGDPERIRVWMNVMWGREPFEEAVA